MDDVVRGGRLFLILGAGAAGAIACGTLDAMPVGVSTPRAPERATFEAGAPMAPLPEDFRAHMARVAERFLSEGHGEAFDAVVWANDAARAGTAAGGDFPDGAMFVEEALGRSLSDAGSVGLLVMQKRGGGWQFGAVGPDGEPGSGAACAACHQDAPRDAVFLLGGSAAPQSSSAAAIAAMNAIAPRTVATAAPMYDTRSAESDAGPSRR